MPQAIKSSKYEHVEWLELDQTGILVECAVMKKDDLGNIWFFRLDNLDMVDKKRLSKIITNKNAGLFSLWDLMSNVRLNNGCNSLEYFHQLVKILTPQGTIIGTNVGQIGTPEHFSDTINQTSPISEDVAPSSEIKTAKIPS